MVGLSLLVAVGKRTTGLLVIAGLTLTASIFLDYVTPSDWDFGYSLGRMSLSPQSVSGKGITLAHGVGSLRVELTEAELDGTGRLSATTGMGTLRVTVPKDVDVDVSARAGIGSARLFGQQRSLIGATLVASEKVPNPRATLRLDPRWAPARSRCGDDLGESSGLVFLFLALITIAGRLGYVELSSIVFVALAILGGSFMILGRALHIYQTGRKDGASEAHSTLRNQ